MSDSHEITFAYGMPRRTAWDCCTMRITSSISRWPGPRCSAARGISYREVEDAGHFLVIIDIGCKFKKPAYYDDLLTIRTTVARVTHVKIVHEYHVFRDGVLLAEGHSTLACVDREGKPQALPATLT